MERIVAEHVPGLLSPKAASFRRRTTNSPLSRRKPPRVAGGRERRGHQEAIVSIR